jgi:hypothetical protein
MKKSTLLFSALALFAAVSCSDDDSDSAGYSFKDQTLTGKIGGEAWTQKSGFSSIGTYLGETSLSVTLVGTIVDGEEGCDIRETGDNIFFDVPATVGVYVLSMSSEDPRTATLYDDGDGMNYIATTGAIEILTITDTEVTGRIDARSEEASSVNGNFTVKRCDL